MPSTMTDTQIDTIQPSIKRSWRRRMGWALLVLLVIVGILVTGSAAWERMASAQAQSAYPPRGEFVDVGGARMHVICQGEGSPTLVMQAGIGGGALDWLPVMDDLSNSYRVCAFDRLGQDWSNAAPQPRMFADAADELHVAIQALGIEKPVVIGHSLGGAVVQVYTARYPVAGVALVDGLSADAAEAVVQRLGTYEKLNGAARLGLLRPMGGLFANAAYPDALRAEMGALRAQSTTLLGMANEGAVAAATAPEDLRTAEAALEAPLLIIAAGESGLPEEELFLLALENLHHRHANSTFTLIPDAPHYLIASHVDQVVDALSDWLGTLQDG